MFYVCCCADADVDAEFQGFKEEDDGPAETVETQIFSEPAQHTPHTSIYQVTLQFTWAMQLGLSDITI